MSHYIKNSVIRKERPESISPVFAPFLRDDKLFVSFILISYDADK